MPSHESFILKDSVSCSRIEKRRVQLTFTRSLLVIFFLVPFDEGRQNSEKHCKKTFKETYAQYSISLIPRLSIDFKREFLGSLCGKLKYNIEKLLITNSTESGVVINSLYLFYLVIPKLCIIGCKHKHIIKRRFHKDNKYQY